jgi:hypothetical protein
MRTPGILLLLAMSLMSPAGAESAKPLPITAADWVVEQMPGGRVAFTDGGIEIWDRGGCTVWYRRELRAPVEIRYEAMVVDEGRPGDRVSDLNCFWMATDPRHPADLFATGNGRTGAFKTYDDLRLYYVGYGGNGNTTTRFRRYAGDGTKPLRPEDDLSAAKFLLEANRWYRISLDARDGRARFFRDGEKVFDVPDAQFLDRGWFGVRTVSSHLRIRNVRILPRP